MPRSGRMRIADRFIGGSIGPVDRKSVKRTAEFSRPRCGLRAQNVRIPSDKCWAIVTRSLPATGSSSFAELFRIPSLPLRVPTLVLTHTLPLPVLTSLITRALISTPLVANFHKQRTRPADASRLRVEFGKRIVEMPAYFSKASFGCCYPDSVVVSVCPCPPLGVCPSVGDCRCRPFAQMCNLRSLPQSIPPTESFST